MLPEVIIHNSISIDGSLLNFDINMNIHYQIARNLKANIHLVGSNTAKIGIDTFMKKIPEETKEDYKKPNSPGMLWAIPDSTTKLKGLLHVFRQSVYCKDVIIFISKKTSQSYINYLKERDYDYFILGQNKCDLKKGLNILNKKYGAKTILVDTGKILGNHLLNLDIVDKLSLLIHPEIVGNKSYNMFSHIEKSIRLKLIKKETLEKDYLWILYKVQK